MVRLLPVLAVLLAASAHAQVVADTARAQPPAVADSLAAPPDTTARPPASAVSQTDAGAAPDPGAVPDTVDTPTAPIALPVPRAPAAEGGLDRAVRYTATDSLRVTLAPRDRADPDGPGDVVTLFGNVQTEYEGAQISAGRVDYESAREVLRASGVPSDSGDVGVPQFQGEEGQFSGREVVYNLRTRRGRVTGARTQIEDGYLLGGILKQQDAHVVFAQDAAYTTCELDHPHYAVEAGRIKVVDGERVFTGPVRLKLLGVPMPLILPFGYFPAAEGRRSGPLPFTYGRDSNYGLYLDDVGWYWAISDYLDAQLTGKVGTQGSFQLDGQVRYNKRYAYSGQVGLQYGRIVTGEPTDPGYAPRTPVGLRWSHNQTFPAGQRLTASVNLQSVSQRLASDNVADQLQASTSSSVSYAQQWPSVGRSLNASVQAFQDFANNRTTATLPQVSFSQQRRFPFRSGRDDRWYEKISYSYTANAQNAFAFTPLSDSTGVSALDALFSPSAFVEATCADPDDRACDTQRFDYQVVQTVPISASFSVPRFNLTFGPNLTYTETWTDEAVVQTYDEELKRVVTTSDPGFTPFRRIALSASASTELYGTFPVRIGALDGIRHTITPQASLSFEPDYEAFGFIDDVQVDSTGRTRRYAINPTIPIDPTRALNLSIQNTFVGRTVRVDSTGEERSQTNQLLSLSLSGGYNFAAEEQPIRPVTTRFTTTAYGVNASGGATFSAYAIDTLGTGSPLTYFETNGRPLRLTNTNVQISRTFQSARRSGATDVRPVFGQPLPGDPYDPSSFLPRSAAVGYVDYSAPWSVALGLTLNRSASATGDARTLATLDVSQFNTRLTQNWSLTGSTGLDLTSMEITTTRLGLRRDLHCWELAINWQPIGVTKLFAVSLYVKSGFLRDFLRLDVPNSTVRTGGFGGSGLGF